MLSQGISEKLFNSKKVRLFQYPQIILTIKLLGELIMKKVSKETKKEQRYNANLHNIFVKAQKEINANE